MAFSNRGRHTLVAVDASPQCEAMFVQYLQTKYAKGDHVTVFHVPKLKSKAKGRDAYEAHRLAFHKARVEADQLRAKYVELMRQHGALTNCSFEVGDPGTDPREALVDKSREVQVERIIMGKKRERGRTSDYVFNKATCHVECWPLGGSGVAEVVADGGKCCGASKSPSKKASPKKSIKFVSSKRPMEDTFDVQATHL